MIKFTDKSLFVKGVGSAVLTDPDTGEINYESDKFTAASVTASVDLGEIRAGLGNAIVAMLPTNSGIAVEFTASDFNLWAKAAQVGSDVTYGAPVPVCQTVTALTSALSIDVSGGTPVAQLGMSDVVCYVQKVGESSPISADGVPYPVDSVTGLISGFTATSGEQYKVWYFINKPTAQKAVIGTLMDPKVVHFSASFAVYANSNGKSNAGTRVGWLYVVIPRLKLNANASLNGDQTNADTTMISGQAISYDEDVVSATCDECGEVGNDLAYYIYSPCSDAEVVRGLAVVGGVVSLPVSTSAQIPVKLVMPDHSLVDPASYSDGFTYEAEGAPTGTSVGTSGVVTAGSTAGDFEVEVTYTDGVNTFTLPVNVEVTSA